jgi:archaellum component FlaC
MALIYFDKAIINTIGLKHSIDDPIVQALFQALLKLYLDNDNKKINEILDNIKKLVENRERYEHMLSREEINKPRGIIPATSLLNVIVENLMAIPERLEDVKDYLEEIGLAQEYAKEEIKEIEELQKRVRHWRRYIEQPSASRGRLSISKYLHEYATNVYDVLYSVNENFRKISNKIIEINKSNDLKELLETAKSVIEGAEQAILSTIIASDEICLSSGLHSDRHMTSYDDIMALLLGMPMPHPVSYSEPGSGCLLVSDEVEISGSKIKLKGKVLRNVNRDYVLRNVPFTHYEVS